MDVVHCSQSNAFVESTEVDVEHVHDGEAVCVDDLDDSDTTIVSLV